MSKKIDAPSIFLKHAVEKISMHNGALLVKPLLNTGETDGGIYLPVERDGDYQYSRCEVVKVCEGSKFKPGDTIFASKFAPGNVMINVEGEDVELWILRESAVDMSESV